MSRDIANRSTRHRVGVHATQAGNQIANRCRGLDRVAVDIACDCRQRANSASRGLEVVGTDIATRCREGTEARTRNGVAVDLAADRGEGTHCATRNGVAVDRAVRRGDATNRARCRQRVARDRGDRADCANARTHEVVIGNPTLADVGRANRAGRREGVVIDRASRIDTSDSAVVGGEGAAGDPSREAGIIQGSNRADRTTGFDIRITEAACSEIADAATGDEVTAKHCGTCARDQHIADTARGHNIPREAGSVQGDIAEVTIGNADRAAQSAIHADCAEGDPGIDRADEVTRQSAIATVVCRR